MGLVARARGRPATSAKVSILKTSARSVPRRRRAGHPWCDTDAMAAHLIEISAAVDPGAHAVLIVDQAGWNTPKLAIPDNITVLAATIARVSQKLVVDRIFGDTPWNNLIALYPFSLF